MEKIRNRKGKSHENSSCWIRVSQAGAGSGFGNVMIPRVGHEVIVSFLEGDPDQPIITGVVFNAVTMVAYELPLHKTRTIMRSKTYKDRGFNEIISYEENFFIHSQKDHTIRILNNKTNRIDNHEVHSTGGS